MSVSDRRLRQRTMEVLPRSVTGPHEQQFASADVDRSFPLTDVEAELLEFPGGLHDDIVSSASIMGNEVGPKDKGKRIVQMIGAGGRAGPLDPRQTPGMPTYRRGSQ
jgi:hypothetical protein